MARPSNTDTRRAEIARAFLEVLAKHGYEGATTAAVARVAGLAPGLVHYHFESKLEILLEALDRLVADHESALEARLGRAAGPTAELDAFIDHHLALETRDPVALACWVTLSGEALREKRVRKPFEAALASSVARLTKIIERGRRAGDFQCAKPRVAASALVAAIQGYFVLAATAPGRVPRGSAAKAVRLMARGLLHAPR